MARDQRAETVNDLLENGGAGVDTIDAGRQQQRLGDRIERADWAGRLLECEIH